MVGSPEAVDAVVVTFKSARAETRNGVFQMNSGWFGFYGGYWEGFEELKLHLSHPWHTCNKHRGASALGQCLFSNQP